MKKSEIVDSVQELVQDKSGPMRNIISRWVNIVLDAIAAEGLLPSLVREEMTKLGVGQRDYILPPSTDKVQRVFVPAWGSPGTKQGILTKKSHDDFLDQMFLDGFSTQGRPTIYTLFGENLRVHPLPRSEDAPAAPTTLEKLHIYKVKDISHLADTEEIVEIRQKHTPTILWGAYVFGARFDNLLDVTDAERNYRHGLRLLAHDLELDKERARQVRMHW